MAQWTIREQLILGSAVQRSGDQNWVSVSRTIRPLSEENRQADFYSQKNCALHYAALLDSASTPKRKKKRGSESETAGETTQDLIVRELTEKRLSEINKLLDNIRSEYYEVKRDFELIEKGQLSDDDIINMWNRVKDVDHSESLISQHVSLRDEVRSDQRNERLTSDPKLDVPTSNVDILLPSVSIKPVTSTDTSKPAMPLIATPIITPVGNSATLIKIEPNVAMETVAAKPVQVKVLSSHDDHTYSSPGPPTILTATSIAEVNEDKRSADASIPIVAKEPVKDQATRQAVPRSDEVILTDDQAVLSEDPVITAIPSTDDKDITNQPLTTDQVVSDTNQSDIKQTTCSTQDHVPKDGQTAPSDLDTTSSAAEGYTVDQVVNKTTLIVQQSSPTATPVSTAGQQDDQAVDDQIASVQATLVDPVTPNPADPSTLTNDQNQTSSASEQVGTPIATPVIDQGTDQGMSSVEKKSRTRGSSRIAGKMKMAQVSKARGSSRASSPRTMVIIGQQQTTIESDNEEIQVHYKAPARRLHRLLSNEPSESEEEALSAVTSAVTSPSSSMIDEVDPELAQSMKMWRKSIMLVWQHASQHKFASLFLHAVKDDEATGYSEVVFRPMDLSLIKKKIETGVIRNYIDFQHDMLLMFQNALMYNSSNHDVFMMADEMRKDVMENIQDYLATQLMVHTSARTKILRSRDSRRIDQDEEVITPLRKARQRLPSDESISSASGAPVAKKMRTRTNNED